MEIIYPLTLANVCIQRFTYRSLIRQFVQSANSGMENHTAISVKKSPSYVKQAPRIHSQGSRKQLSPSFCTTPAALGEFLWILHTIFHNGVAPTAARLLEMQRRGAGSFIMSSVLRPSFYNRLRGWREVGNTHWMKRTTVFFSKVHSRSLTLSNS